MADKAANTRNQVKELTDRLEEGTQALFESDKYLSYLRTMSKFHRYSTRNTVLIHLQMPEASRVAGFRAWQEKFSRHVKKGEKGIRIFAPAPFKVKKEMEKLDPDTQVPLLGKDGKPVTEEVEVTIPQFKVVPVFDVSQTDGKPLPTLAENLTGNVQQYEAFLEALKHVSRFPIQFEVMEPNTDGVCRFDAREIAIREGMSEIQTISAVVHEMSHAELHDYEQEQEAENAGLEDGDEPAKPKSRRSEEVEAESISYVVCQHYGIETGANSFGYLAAWSKTRELSELKASLETIRKTAASMIDRIDEKFAEICKERSIDLTPIEPIEVRIPPDRQAVEQFASDYYEYMAVFPFDRPFSLDSPEETKAGIVEKIMQGQFKEIRDSLYLVLDIKDAPSPDGLLRRLRSFDQVTYKMPEQTTEPVETEPPSVPSEPAPSEPQPEKQYDLGFGHLGNGLTVWNRLEEKNGDYVTVAHIAPDRTITYRENELPDNIKAEIEEVARTSDMTVSATQDTPVFTAPSQNTAEPEQAEPEQISTDRTLPDSKASIELRNDYGYTADELLPLTRDRALELFDADHTIYMLYEDNTEAMAFEREEIETFDGLFGIETDEWEASQEFAQMEAAARNSEASMEAALIYSKEDTFGIYQLKDGDELRYHRWAHFGELQENGLTVDRANYELVYTAPLAEKVTLGHIVTTFNIDHPADFRGHSLSTSDIVVMNKGGEITSYYDDGGPFIELPDFLGNEKQPELDPLKELAVQIDEFSENYDHYGYHDDVEDREENIQTIVQMIEDGEISGIKEMLEDAIEEDIDAPEAKALLQKLVTYEKTAEPEQSVPSVAELEAQVKAGKQISLTDLARAVKNEPKRSEGKGKTSILAQLQDGKKTASHSKDTPKNAPKRNSEREV